MMIKALDLFHGMGGSSLGAEMARVKVVAAIDYWDIAHKCYSINFPETLSINADIRDVSPNYLHGLTGDIDLIIASPECTSHSCAKGARKGCEYSKLQAFEVIRFAREFMPKWIIIENVVQMASWNLYEEFTKQIKNLGYYVVEKQINSKDFGVPQSRKRLFLLCSLIEPFDFKCPVPAEYKTAKTIIERNGKYKFTPLRRPNRALATIERAERAISVLGESQPFLIVYYGSDGSGGWQSLDKPLRTITTLDRFAYVKYSDGQHVMRMLQPDELKLAMGFPSCYRFADISRRDRIKLSGNAVCPPVMEYSVRTLIQQNHS